MNLNTCITSSSLWRHRRCLATRVRSSCTSRTSMTTAPSSTSRRLATTLFTLATTSSQVNHYQLTHVMTSSFSSEKSRLHVWKSDFYDIHVYDCVFVKHWRHLAIISWWQWVRSSFAKTKVLDKSLSQNFRLRPVSYTHLTLPTIYSV